MPQRSAHTATTISKEYYLFLKRIVKQRSTLTHFSCSSICLPVHPSIYGQPADFAFFTLTCKCFWQSRQAALDYATGGSGIRCGSPRSAVWPAARPRTRAAAVLVVESGAWPLGLAKLNTSK